MSNLSHFFLLGVMVALTGLMACRPEPTEELPEYDPTPYVLDIGDFPPPPPVAGNPLTRAGVQLGRMLFYEQALSADGSQACADCHRQGDGFSDPRQFSIGVAGLPGHRQSMAVFNLAWHRNGFFWDGRAPSLRHQALQPIQDPLEMNEELLNVIRKLGERKGYRHQFIRAFGDEQVTEERIGLALEQFMRVLVSNNSKYDRFLRGQVSLTDSEERGRALYFGEYDPLGVGKGAECFHCHAGFNLTNDQYMNNGLDSDAEFTDMGLFAVTGKASDMARFKVPSLRNIAVTAPYMHDGRFTTLEEVIQHYNTGVKPSSTIDFLLHYNLNPGGLRLDEQDIADLVAFLHTLTDPEFLQDTSFSRPF